MKRIVSVLFSIVLGLCIPFALSGCGEKSFDDSLPSKSALVSVDYGDTTQKKARLQIKNNNESFDISGFALYCKTNKKKIKNLYGGDRLEVYYSDDSYEKIDHVLVKPAKVLVLELYSSPTPGSGNAAVYSKDKSVVVNHTEHGVFWAIDKSGSFIELEDLYKEYGVSPKLYGTYIEEEIVVTNVELGLKLHYIHALYTYDPR